MNYNSSRESVRITVEEGKFTRKSGRVAIKKQKVSRTGLKDAYQKENLTISGYGKTRKTNIWAIRSLYGLGIGNPGLTDFPIKKGESMKIISDNEDKDNDGKKGIEKNDVIVLYSKDENVDAPIERYWPSKDKRYYK
jgi:hypothetical protein